MIPAATRYQHIDRQRSGVTPSKRPKPLGLLRCKFALLYQPSGVENDLDGRPPSRVYTRHNGRQSERPREDAPETVTDRQKFEAAAAVPGNPRSEHQGDCRGLLKNAPERSRSAFETAIFVRSTGP
jgi:hypothetical protein